MASSGGVGLGGPGTIAGIKGPSLPPRSGGTGVKIPKPPRAAPPQMGLKGPQTPTLYKPPKAPKPAKPPTAGTATTTAPAAPSPYDATYYVDLANATLGANNKIGTYAADIANGQTNLQNTLSQLGYNQGLATTKDQDAENARGGFAQGALGQTLGQLGHAYLTTESGDANKYAQDAASWNQAIAGVRSGLSIEQIALGLASTARQAALTAKDPGASGGTPGSTTTTPGAPGSASAPTTAKGGSAAPKVLSTRSEGRSSRGGGAPEKGRSGGKGKTGGAPIRTTPRTTGTSRGSG